MNRRAGLATNPANAHHIVLRSFFLGRDAVHAGMAGKTKVLIGHLAKSLSPFRRIDLSFTI